MRKIVVPVVLALCMLALWAAATPARADGEPHLEIRAVDTLGAPYTATMLGCAYRIVGSGQVWIPDVFDYCETCSVYTCTYSTWEDSNGGYISVDEGEILTATDPLTGAIAFSNYLGTAVVWSDVPWTSTRIITFTVEIQEVTPFPTATPLPTPLPTATPDDPSAYSEEYWQVSNHHVYFPIIFRNCNEDCLAGLPPGSTPGDPIGSDATWWDWAQKLEAFVAPVQMEVTAVRSDISTLNDEACGTPWTTFAPPLDPLAFGVEMDTLAGTPNAQQIAFALGASLGRPMAWLRSIQQSNSVVGLNFFVMLVYFLAAGIGWLTFVAVLTYSLRLIRLAVAWAIKLYELIPFKAT